MTILTVTLRFFRASMIASAIGLLSSSYTAISSRF